uniref:BTB domain-containing protein n=1 Tax=Ascaris lumbricoides TaxID=6252 RepID=A0A9J2PRV1_ASCLU
MLVRTKSRSKSPAKYANNDFQQWANTAENGHYQMPYYPYNYHRSTFEDNVYGGSVNQPSSSPTTRAPLAVPEGSLLGLSPQYNRSSPPLSTITNEEPIWNTMTSQASQTSIGSHRSELHTANRAVDHKETSESLQILDAREPRSQYPHFQSNLTLDSQKTHDSLRRPDYGTLENIHMSRPRSNSPVKAPRTTLEGFQKKSRSKSPHKKSSQINTTLDYLSPQCQSEGCSAAIIVQDTRFLVCKHQLSHASDYFRSLFLANKSLPVSGAYQSSMNEFAIVVSSFVHPPPATQFRWFLECAIQAPVLKDITDDTLETCMRLSKRFRAQGLEMRCARYIQDNVQVNKKVPMVALCWLNWVLKHKFDRATHDACLPCVASASLNCLEQHRNMITEKLLADLLAAKLRTLYAVNVFQTIHSMDHFYVDVDRCPRCNRQREQGKVRVYASPCKKLLGCERCMKDYGCEIATKAREHFQAFYQCKHGLTALNDNTPDCQCQLPSLANYLSKANASPSENPLANGPPS